jgi:hypothetical protein
MWMNLLAPFAAPVFGWNHDRLMKAGGEGLAQRLGADVSLEEVRGPALAGALARALIVAVPAAWWLSRRMTKR